MAIDHIRGEGERGNQREGEEKRDGERALHLRRAGVGLNEKIERANFRVRRDNANTFSRRHLKFFL